MRTLRQLMECSGIDASQGGSVLFDYFGFSRGRLPSDPTGAAASVSVLGQAARVDSEHIHLNVIRVGFDALSSTDRATALEDIDHAVHRTRAIFGTRGLGVGRVRHFEIATSDAAGRDDVGSDAEADALSDEWSVPDDGIDAFVPRTISASFLGVSPVGGSCDKGDDDDGLVAGATGRGAEGFARTFAHEVGHFLGLEHNHGSSCPTSDAGRRNLMAQTKCVPLVSGSTSVRDVRNAARLTSSQGSTMRDHCASTVGC